MTSAKTAGRYFLYKANTFYYILFDTNIITETRIFVKDLRRADLDKFFRRVKLKNNKTDVSDFFTQAHNDDPCSLRTQPSFCRFTYAYGKIVIKLFWVQPV